MKGAKSVQQKAKRSAEEWVAVARKFGEECVKIQKDPKLNIDQKLEKQKVLSDKMAKEIQDDPHLSEADKKQMINSINSYMDDWRSLHDKIQQRSDTEEQPSKEQASKEQPSKEQSSKKKK